MRSTLALLMVAATGMHAWAADLGAESAAWAPLANQPPALYPGESRPSWAAQEDGYGQALASVATRKRLNGQAVVERAGNPGDAQLAIGHASTQHGYTAFGYFGPSCTRTSLTARLATDPLATDPGKALAAVGAGAMASFAGGPIGIWGEAGWSDERSWFARGEACLILAHVVMEGDESVRSMRGGLCLRWPGGALARSPQSDPWSFALSVDHAETTVEDLTVRGTFGELTLGWRCTDHVLITGQVQGTDTTIRDGAKQDGLVSGSLGVGWIW